MQQDNRFTPPQTAVADVLSLQGGSIRLDYEVGRLDFFLFNIVHQFRLLPLQFVYISLSVLIAAFMRSGGVAVVITCGIAVYIFQWAFQILFTGGVTLFSKNRRLYTRHQVETQKESLFVSTSYARQYHYWYGIEKVVVAPWFVAVYINTHSAHIIPTRAFLSNVLRKDFIKLVETLCAAGPSR